MKRIHQVALRTSALVVLAACSSSHNDGSGQCADFRGAYQGTLTCSDGMSNATSDTVTQICCMLTVTDNQSGDSFTANASGSKASSTATIAGSTQTCDVTLAANNQYTQT